MAQTLLFINSSNSHNEIDAIVYPYFRQRDQGLERHSHLLKIPWLLVLEAELEPSKSDLGVSAFNQNLC